MIRSTLLLVVAAAFYGADAFAPNVGMARVSTQLFVVSSFKYMSEGGHYRPPNGSNDFHNASLLLCFEEWLMTVICVCNGSVKEECQIFAFWRWRCPSQPILAHCTYLCGKECRCCEIACTIEQSC